jgi:hypothetical protein
MSKWAVLFGAILSLLAGVVAASPIVGPDDARIIPLVYFPATDAPKLEKAWTHGSPGGASPNFPATYYNAFANASTPLANTSFIPFGVWFQVPTQTGHSGSYANSAVAAKAAGINIFFGVNAYNWPTSFGADTTASLPLVKTEGQYIISGGDPASNTSAHSVASIASLCATDNACGNVIGYSWVDEPPCGSGAGQQGNVPTEITAVEGFDSTRVIIYNQAGWVPYDTIFPSLSGCQATAQTALAAPSIVAYDQYPNIAPWYNNSSYCGAGASVQVTDYNTIPYDCLWVQGMGVQVLVSLSGGLGTKAIWPFLDTGTDALGYSSQNNTFTGGVSNTSTTLTIPGSSPRFSSNWVGLKVAGTGIPTNTTISSITDSTHAVMSAAATGGSSSETITVTGGVVSTGGCVATSNLCYPNGNEYRSTAVQVNSEVWMAFINGANGILYFCHDETSDQFCLNDTGSGGAAAAAVFANLTYIDTTVTSYAQQLNAVTSGLCSMQNLNGTVSTSCTNGILTYATGTSSCPGSAMSKTYSGATWLFVISDRSSNSSGAGCYVSGSGATFTATLTGLAGKTATVKYDSNSQYDPTNDTTNATHLLNGSAQFTDTLGDHSDSYRVKIYQVQ